MMLPINLFAGILFNAFRFKFQNKKTKITEYSSEEMVIVIGNLDISSIPWAHLLFKQRGPGYENDN